MLRDPSLIPLSHDHQHALALCLLTERALVSDSGPDNITQQAERILEQFDAEIHHHFDLEEQFLFPALAALPETRDLVGELRNEHHRMVSLIGLLRAGSELAVIQEFCNILRQHVRKEEQSLFEEAQRLLSREELDDIGRKLARPP